jgi:Flp pilus assembly protein TadG
MSKRRIGRGGQAGQALVEFSLAFLVFMIVVIGIIDVARAVWNYNTLSNAVREGTRYGIVHGSASTAPAGPTANNAALEAHVEDFAGGLDLSELTVSSTWPDGNNDAGSRVRVTGSYDFQPMFGALINIPPITLTSTSTMNITN